MNLLKNIICQSDNFWASRRSTISWGLKWPGSWLDTRKSQTIQRSDLQQSWCVEISWVRVESNPCRRKRGNRGRMTDNEPEWAPPEFGKPQPGRDSRSASAASSGKQHRRFRKTGFGWGEKFGLDEQDSQATLRLFKYRPTPASFLIFIHCWVCYNTDYNKRLRIIRHFRITLTAHVFASEINSAMGGSPG